MGVPFYRVLAAFVAVLLLPAAAFAGRPAARAGDRHSCPMVTGLVPHVGGPIVGGSPTVLVCGKPAAHAGLMATCVGPPDTLPQGSTRVLIGGKPAVRQGDHTAHGGVVTEGCATVLIGD